MSWCTIQAVKDLTGVELEDATGDPLVSQCLRIAVSVIELRVGLIEDQTPNIAGRDGHFLRNAVAFQAVYVQDQPDLFLRHDITTQSQDGQSANYRAGGIYLAPLARASLKRLSWKGTHSTTAQTADGGRVYDDDLDRYGRPLGWRPL